MSIKFKKNLLLNFSKKYKIFYKPYLYYNLYVRNLKYLFQKSYSQFEEDTFIKKFFSKKKGFYIDIGCNQPFINNNTFLLYKSGWSGINIDLSKINIDLFDITRPRDKNICEIISNKDRKVEYYIPNNNPLSTEITVKRNFAKILQKKHKNIYQKKTRNSMKWSSIKKKYNLNINKVDFLKIDVEGADFDVLKEMNISKLKPRLIMIEAPVFEKKSIKRINLYMSLKSYKAIYKNQVNIIFKRI
tara:strand:+ start:494 stop:1225 length:732 start_codon:yes stop_codon:yes gene_type:complete